MQTLAGFSVGALVGLTGVGGGALMTPLLTLAFGVPPVLAVGTDLAFACATKSAGVLAHRRLGHVRWDIAGLLCLGAIPAALLAVLELSRHSALDPQVSSFIKTSIGVCVGLTALSLLAKPKLLAWLASRSGPGLSQRVLRCSTVACGALLGALVAISSIGAGSIGATAIALLYPRLRAAEVAGTDIAYAVPLTLFAAIAHWRLGSIDWALLGSLLAGSLPGILLGSLGAKLIPDTSLRLILCALLVLISVKMFF